MGGTCVRCHLLRTTWLLSSVRCRTGGWESQPFRFEMEGRKEEASRHRGKRPSLISGLWVRLVCELRGVVTRAAYAPLRSHTSITDAATGQTQPSFCLARAKKHLTNANRNRSSLARCSVQDGKGPRLPLFASKSGATLLGRLPFFRALC